MVSLIPVLLYYYSLINSGSTTPSIIKDYIVVEALVAGVNPQTALTVAERESRFNPKAAGDGGKSHGIWQIHLPAHKEVTKEQAQNIIFSTQWSMNEMSKNSCAIWSTCPKSVSK